MLWKYQPPALLWLGSSGLSLKPPLGMIWGTAGDKGPSSHVVWMWPPCSAEQAQVVLQKLREITLSTCDVQSHVWFRVPRPQTCKWGPLSLGPALALLTAGLEHPGAEPGEPRSRACEQKSFWEFIGGFLDVLAVRTMLPSAHTRSHVARSCLFVFSQSFSHSLACHNNPHHPFESLGLYPCRSLYQRKLKLFFLCSLPWPCLEYAVSKKAYAAQCLT